MTTEEPLGDPTGDVAEDVALLGRLGYRQELLRRMSGFSNYAISLSIICILAGGVTSFAQGFCSVGGAAIGIGWPLSCLFSLTVAATMGQIASAYPTAGGLYHWASILGGRGWGWATAWFNLAGLIAVLAAVNDGFVGYACGVAGYTPSMAAKLALICAVTLSHGLLNHHGIQWTTRLTNFSGYWILMVTIALVAALGVAAPSWEFDRLWTFSNFSGAAGGDTFPATDNLVYLFALGLLLPAYTITGFDASAHVAEETVGAAVNVPKGIVRSVLVSGIFGWLMLIVVVVVMRDPEAVAAQGAQAFTYAVRSVLNESTAVPLLVAIGIAQYLCGLAIVTSASRMTFAFARDGGLPMSKLLRWVSPRSKSPVPAIWATAAAAVALTLFAPYSTIAAACAALLYISYVLPTAFGFLAYGNSWTHKGPWHLGSWYRPLALIATVGCGALLWIGIQPPNEQAIIIVGGIAVLLVLGWFGIARRRFPGPPPKLLRSAVD